MFLGQCDFMIFYVTNSIELLYCNLLYMYIARLHFCLRYVWTCAFYNLVFPSFVLVRPGNLHFVVSEIRDTVVWFHKIECACNAFYTPFAGTSQDLLQTFLKSNFLYKVITNLLFKLTYIQ